MRVLQRRNVAEFRLGLTYGLVPGGGVGSLAGLCLLVTARHLSQYESAGFFFCGVLVASTVGACSACLSRRSERRPWDWLWPKLTRRSLQFSVRNLLLAMLVFGVGYAWFALKVQQARSPSVASSAAS
jgi:hypothetical protein